MTASRIVIPARWTVTELPDGKSEIKVHINGQPSLSLMWDHETRTLTEQHEDKNHTHA